MSEEIEAHI